MAQVEGKSFCPAYVEFRPCGEAWADITGQSAGVAVTGGDRDVADNHTGDTDTPFVTGGHKSSLEVTARMVYVENAVYDNLLTAYQEVCDGCAEIRWVPLGNTAGKYRFTLASGIVTQAPIPVGDFGSPDAVFVQLTIKGNKLDKDEVPA